MAVKKSAPSFHRRRIYKVFDVHSKQQGRLRTFLFYLLWFWMLFLSVYWVAIEMFLNSNVEDGDSRDMVDDHRTNLYAMSRRHALFLSVDELESGAAVLNFAGERSSDMSWSERDDGHTEDISDPRFSAIWRTKKFKDTSYEHRVLSTRVSVSFPTWSLSSSETATVPLRLPSTSSFIFASQNEFSVPQYRTNIKWVNGTVSVERLAGVTARVSHVPSGPLANATGFNATWGPSNTVGRLFALTGVDLQWDVAETDTLSAVLARGGVLKQNAAGGALAKSVSLQLVDESAPELVVPTFTGITRFYLAGVLMIINLTVMPAFAIWAKYKININSQVNNNLPPPFFASRTKYRGW